MGLFMILKDGYLKIEKDHKVTNAKNVADMVNTIRTALGGERWEY